MSIEIISEAISKNFILLEKITFEDHSKEMLQELEPERATIILKKYDDDECTRQYIYLSKDSPALEYIDIDDYEKIKQTYVDLYKNDKEEKNSLFIEIFNEKTGRLKKSYVGYANNGQ